MTLYFFLSTACLLACVFLITNKNPVYSVLNLVLLFVTGSLLLLILGLDFLPFVFVVVYVGAVAVMFLFVVIMLDIKLSYTKKNKKLIPIVVTYSFLNFLYFKSLSSQNLGFYDMYFSQFREDFYVFGPAIYDFYEIDKVSSLRDFGNVLYIEFIDYVIIGGFLLLVAIIGAIVLTSRRGNYSLKQKVFKQTERFYIVGKTKLINKP